ncbi:MAG: GNAT family N-acetyltransferase [Eggerthellaceae bacterium]|nr:GNAT family N-acetyltransferase [Eggerthellaceae bacterium]
MLVEFRPVTSDADKEGLAQLAGDIWREYWPALIGEEQTEYMVANFQSLEAIERDMAEHGYEYWLVLAADELTAPELEQGAQPAFRVVGYTGGHVEEETNRFFISKIYLLAGERGKHFASRIIEFYERLCAERGLRAMYLTVNKHNDLGIRAYKAKGFKTIDAVETDIGQDFVMDDYIMEREVGA